MALAARITTSGKSITALLDDALSPQAQSKALAGFARQELQKGEEQNRRVFGSVPDHTTTVDGRREASLESVKPNGVIVFEFQLIGETLAWIMDQLRTHSPVLTGAYQASHTLFADGIEADPANPPAAEEYVFLPTVPYARALEEGHSKQAPEGVYHVVATLAQGRFGNQARIVFTYRAPFGMSFRHLTGKARRQAEKDVRQPAIEVKLR